MLTLISGTWTCWAGSQVNLPVGSEAPDPAGAGGLHVQAWRSESSNPAMKDDSGATALHSTSRPPRDKG